MPIQGLSEPAQQIIEKFSALESIKGYQLVGGTALSITLNHRKSEDLDFCQWVPDARNVKYGIDEKKIHSELTSFFGRVESNHLDFYQVNFYIEEPGVKITFYHTDLKRPTEQAKLLIGNIEVAALEVLGGSKIYVTTRRLEIRDYYDIYVLIDQKYLAFDNMLKRAYVFSREANPKRIQHQFAKVNFTEENFNELQRLKPTCPLKDVKTLNDFFKGLSENLNLKKSNGIR